MSASPPTSPADRRTRAVRLTLAGSAGAKVFAMLCTLAQVPIALRYLGGEGYGLWITLMSLFGLLNFVDFGLGAGVQTQMAAAFATGDERRLRQAFTSGVAILAGLGGVVLLVGLPLAYFGAWGAWFKVQDPALRAQVPAALAVLLGAFAIGLPGNAVAQLAAAVQLNWWHSLWNMAGNFLTLTAVWFAARSGWGFLPFVAVAALLPTVQNLGMGWQLRHRLGWRGPGPGVLPRTEWRAVFRTSALFMLPQAGQAALGWLPAFAISLGAGAGAVTAFNLIQRLLGPLTNSHGILLAPLWPVFAEASVRQDWDWLRRARARALLATLGCVAGVALVCWQAPRLLGWWLGPQALLPTAALTWLAGLWYSLQLVSRHYHYFLLGTDRLQPLALFSTLGLAGSLAGLLAGSHLHGATGALALGSAGYGLLALPGLAWAGQRQPGPRAA